MARHNPGEWYGVVTPAGVALLSTTVPPSAVEQVWQDLRSGNGLGAVIDGLVGAFGTSLSTLPAFGVLSLIEEGGVRVALRGDVEVHLWLTGGGDPTVVSGLGVTTWTERAVAGVDRAELLVPGATGGSLLPIVDGIVRTGRLVISLLEPDAEPAPPGGLPQAPEAAPTESVIRSAETMVATDVPNEYDQLLYGETVLSSVEAAAVRPDEPELTSPGPPDAASVAGATIAPEPGDRPGMIAALPSFPAALPSFPAAPALGDHDGETVLVEQLPSLQAGAPSVGLPEPPPVPVRPYPNLLLAGRAPFPLDRTAIVGTRPRLSRVQGTNVPHLVTVVSPSGEISRSHIELRVEGFAVLAVDLDSTNGTTLLRVANEPVRLHPGEPNLLVPGDRLDLGDDVVLDFDGLG